MAGMASQGLPTLRDRIPGFRRLTRLPSQVIRRNPFEGDIIPSRAPLVAFGSGRPTLPFPHPWNYKQPIRILHSYFWDAEDIEGPGRHNRYLEVPWFPPVLVTRDLGKNLGQMEVALVVGTFVKLFRFKAVNQENPERAGVSTKPLDGVMIELIPRSKD